MVEGGGGPAFPVVFYDGEREMNIGDVRIYPTLEYKPFQLMLSQKIGISPNQISIYLVDKKKNHKSPFWEERRRIPITGKVNFNLICRQRDCCFLVVLKRSRKSRNRRERTANIIEFGDIHENEFFPPRIHSVPENMILLRRNQQLPFYDQITQSELADMSDRLESMRVRGENFRMAMATGNLNPDSSNFTSDHFFDSNSVLNLGMDSIPMADDLYGFPPLTTMTNNKIKKAFCEECLKEEKFHHCVNDAVIAPFRTRWGPIRPPTKPFR